MGFDPGKAAQPAPFAFYYKHKRKPFAFDKPKQRASNSWKHPSLVRRIRSDLDQDCARHGSIIVGIGLLIVLFASDQREP
jgi:hypothetical protein